MKILVYGAGMIGSIIAAQLEQSGQDVTILARGVRAQQLRDYGIVSRTFEGDTYHSAHPQVIEQLTPEHHFNLIIVVVRRNQQANLLSALAQNDHYQTVLFMGNNLGGARDIQKVLSAEKVMLGFGGTSGEKRGDIIYHFGKEGEAVGAVYLGELNGKITPRLLELQQIFQSARFRVSLERNIDAWLKTHAALILPLAFGLYLTDGSNYRLAKTRDALVMVYRAICEGFRVLRKRRIPIRPVKYQLIPLLPEPLGVLLLRKIFDSEFARVGLAGHANRARDEMDFLAGEFQSLMQQSGIKTPNLHYLYSSINQPAASVPEGSKQIALNWKPIWVSAGVLTALIGVVGYLMRHKGQKK